METINLDTIHKDLEFLKRAVAQIMIAVEVEPELLDEVKQQVGEARDRISNGEFISNAEMLKEFDIE